MVNLKLERVYYLKQLRKGEQNISSSATEQQKGTHRRSCRCRSACLNSCHHKLCKGYPADDLLRHRHEPEYVRRQDFALICRREGAVKLQGNKGRWGDNLPWFKSNHRSKRYENLLSSYFWICYFRLSSFTLLYLKNSQWKILSSVLDLVNAIILR